MRVAFLGHDQLPGTSHPSGGYLSRDAAALLIHELAAEKISGSVIRAFAPGSTFCASLDRQRCRYIPVRLPSVITEGMKREPSAAERALVSVVPRTRYLSRFREVYGDRQLAASL